MEIILFIVTLLIVFIVSFLFYYGFFKKIKFKISDVGGDILVYTNMIGDYKNCGKFMDEIYFSLKNEFQIHSTKGFGIYYDNPKEIEKSKLKSDIGCVVENVPIEIIIEIEKKYRVKTFPKANYLCTEFPYKNRFSILIALIKIYPALDRFLIKNNLEKKGFVMEIYNIPEKKIFYRKKI